MADSVRPHRRQPTRLPRPWDSPGKNTGVGVGCHFLLQCRKVKSGSRVAQSCPTLSNPMDCSPPGSSVHGIFQARYWSGVPLPSPNFPLKYSVNPLHRVILPVTSSVKNLSQGAVLRRQRNRAGRPLSPPQIHQKNI